jgi:pyruvate,water dikinase
MNRHDGRYVVPLEDLRMTDIESVGGKNASLGEMISQLSASQVRVPGGFATTAWAFREFLGYQDLAARIADELGRLNVDDVAALAECGRRIRGWVAEAPLPPGLEREIREHYARMIADSGGADIPVAVRSSATAEDLPDASFAGQQETFLNVTGSDAVLDRVRHVFASLYNDRAISYRVHKGFAHAEVAL